MRFLVLSLLFLLASGMNGPPSAAPTAMPTTAMPTTAMPTGMPTTGIPSTQSPSTQSPSTQSPSTQSPSTQAPSTANPTSPPSTLSPTTSPPLTQNPTTATPSSSPVTAMPSSSPTTNAPTTQSPTGTPTTAVPTTATPTATPTASPITLYRGYVPPAGCSGTNNSVGLTPVGSFAFASGDSPSCLAWKLAATVCNAQPTASNNDWYCPASGGTVDLQYGPLCNVTDQYVCTDCNGQCHAGSGCTGWNLTVRNCSGVEVSLDNFTVLWHGWVPPAGCAATYNAVGETPLGGTFPYHTSDTLPCKAWKLAATICNTAPVSFFSANSWTCPSAGGFTDSEFGSFCAVSSTMYVCTDCPSSCNAGSCNTYGPMTVRSCSGVEVGLGNSPALWQGWVPPPGCSAANNSVGATPLGGGFPFHTSDSSSCRAWKLAATVCNSAPISYGNVSNNNWYCASAGGFTNQFGSLCSVADEYVCSDCYGNCHAGSCTNGQITSRDCTGTETPLFLYQGLFHGWTPPSGCNATWDSLAATPVGYLPYSAGDVDWCKAWKFAATTCNYPPTAVGSNNDWYCNSSGGFTDPQFGNLCAVMDQYVCSDCVGVCHAGSTCAAGPVSVRNCSGSEVAAFPAANPGIWHGWTPPSGCSATFNSIGSTPLGGTFPYHSNDSPACKAWKLAATICTTTPVGYPTGSLVDWTCPMAGGFTDPQFGMFCAVSGTMYTCADCAGSCWAGTCYNGPISVRNCAGTEVPLSSTPVLWHGWVPPPGCSAANNTFGATPLGGTFPYHLSDSNSCKAWKLAATICNTVPVPYGPAAEADWYCPTAGGFGSFCSVSNEYVCSDCYGNCTAGTCAQGPISVRNCSGTEVAITAAPALWHGYAPPVGCSSINNTISQTPLGGFFPYDVNDSPQCKAWKLAATICNTAPVAYGITDWSCSSSGGFTDVTYGTFCAVSNQFVCTDCSGSCNAASCGYAPMSVRGCGGSETIVVNRNLTALWGGYTPPAGCSLTNNTLYLTSAGYYVPLNSNDPDWCKAWQLAATICNTAPTTYGTVGLTNNWYCASSGGYTDPRYGTICSVSGQYVCSDCIGSCNAGPGCSYGPISFRGCSTGETKLFPLGAPTFSPVTLNPSTTRVPTRTPTRFPTPAPVRADPGASVHFPVTYTTILSYAAINQAVATQTGVSISRVSSYLSGGQFYFSITGSSTGPTSSTVVNTIAVSAGNIATTIGAALFANGITSVGSAVISAPAPSPGGGGGGSSFHHVGALVTALLGCCIFFGFLGAALYLVQNRRFAVASRPAAGSPGLQLSGM